MDALVSLEMVALREALLANAARKSVILCVDAHMVMQRARALVAFIAHLTLPHRLAFVQSLMALQIDVLTKRLWTQRAAENVRRL